jgi:hypothetical protein
MIVHFRNTATGKPDVGLQNHPTIASTLVSVHPKVMMRATMKTLMQRSIAGRVMPARSTRRSRFRQGKCRKSLKKP